MWNLFRVKDFPSLIVSLFFSKLGDYTYEVAFLFIVLEATQGNYFFVGLVYFFKFIPFLFFGPVGGWLADNHNLKFNMLVSEWLRLIVAVIVLVAYIEQQINVFVLTIASFLTTVGRSFFQPSFQSTIPCIVSSDGVLKANSIVQIIEELASILGPICCSFIVFYWDKVAVLGFNAITYIVSIVALFRLRLFSQKKQVSFNISEVYREIFSHIKFLRHENLAVFITIVFSSVCILFTGAILRFVLPAFSIEQGMSEVLTGYLFSVIAVGTIIGGVICSKLLVEIMPKKLMIWWQIYGLIMLMLVISAKISVYLLFPVAITLGIVGSFVDVTLVTIIQKLSSENDIGKNFGVFSTLANTAEAASGLVAGMLATFGVTFSFCCMSILIVITALFGRRPQKIFGEVNHHKKIEK